MNYVNKTNELIKIKKEDGEIVILSPSEEFVKVNETKTSFVNEDGYIEFIKKISLLNIPEKTEGTIYIVDNYSKKYLLDREDIYTVSGRVVDEQGEYQYDSYLVRHV